MRSDTRFDTRKNRTTKIFLSDARFDSYLFIFSSRPVREPDLHEAGGGRR